jgi:hypothetical protein
MGVEIVVIVPLLQITCETAKEHDPASFGLIASFGGIADAILTPFDVG